MLPSLLLSEKNEVMEWQSAGWLVRGVGNAPKKRTRFRNLKISYQISGKISRFHAGFRDFNGDFGISSKISGFQLRFRDFNEDFKISTKISGFQAAGNNQ